MKWNFYWLLSFVVGLGAGYLDLRKRYGVICFEAARTRLGLLYILARGFAPALIFFGLYNVGKINGSWWEAILFGIGFDYVARMGFYNGRQKSVSFTGPYQFLVKLQNSFLESNDGPVAELRKKYVDRFLPVDLDCAHLCEHILTNVGAWPIEKTRKAIRELVNDTKNNSAITNEDRRHSLAYDLLDLVGRRGLRTLLSRRVPSADGRP